MTPAQIVARLRSLGLPVCPRFAAQAKRWPA